MEKAPKTTFLSSFNVLFYISCVLGIMPYSINEYSTNRIFKISVIGNLWSILIMIHNTVQYHFAQSEFSLGNEKQSGTLTVAIGIFIIYMEPFMMIVDIIAGLINQRSLINVVKRMEAIDEKLLLDNIIINYQKIQRITTSVVIFVVTCECTIVLLNYFLFLKIHEFYSLWFLVTIIPITTNTIARIWFFILVFSVRERFQAINEFFVKTKDSIVENKRKYVSQVATKGGGIGAGERNESVPLGYLREEIFSRRKIGNVGLNKWNKAHVTNFKYDDKQKRPDDDDKDYVIGEKMDKKLIMLCRTHDEICEIGKTINKMFSFQMLITMAFGFMSITAQFYFLYCGLAGQNVPKLYRSAENVPISIIYISYTAAKCVSIIYISWRTKTDAQKTGIQLHKIANVVDENHFYHIVNHLSLKLLNHQLNFTACGFFDLDMTTVYAITGAITSYLIILIQFNIAAQRTRKPGDSGDNSTTTSLAPIMNSMLTTFTTPRTIMFGGTTAPTPSG